MRKDEILERETTSIEEDEVSKGETSSYEGGRGFIDHVNVHDKQISPMWIFLLKGLCFRTS